MGKTSKRFPYRSDELVVITSNEHPLAGRVAVTFEETLDFDHVGLRSGSTITLQLLKAASGLNRTIRLCIEVTAYDALCHLVEARAWARDPAQGSRPALRRSSSHPGMALDEPWASRELRICVRSFDALPVAAKQLVEHLKRMP